MTAKPILTRDQIRALKDEPEAVELDQGIILIRSLTANEKDEYEAWVMGMRETKDYRGLRSRLVRLSVVDEKGERVFGGEEDEEAIGNLPGNLIDKLFPICQKKSAMTRKDLAELTGKSLAELDSSISD